jgi:hypothetical protein
MVTQVHGRLYGLFSIFLLHISVDASIMPNPDLFVSFAAETRVSVDHMDDASIEDVAGSAAISHENMSGSRSVLNLSAPVVPIATDAVITSTTKFADAGITGRTDVGDGSVFVSASTLFSNLVAPVRVDVARSDGAPDIGPSVQTHVEPRR